MDKTLGVAVVGCGTISSMHLNAIKQMKAAKLLFVCDIDVDKARKTAFEYDCKYTDDYKTLIYNPDIDIIHILTPHYLHPEMAIEAFNAGKNVVLEKPIGISIKDLKELNKIADKSGPYIAVVLQNRYNPISLYLKKVVESGECGDLIGTKGIVAWYRSKEYYENSNWRGKWQSEGGGVLINQAIHTIDLMQWIGGKVTSVKGHIDNHYHSYIEVEDTALATLYYDNNTVGNFYATNNNGINSSVELEFVFEKATFVQKNEELIKITSGDKSEVVESNCANKGEKGYWGQGHRIYIEDVYKHILNKKKPPITIKEALVANEIVLGIYESSKTNQVYSLNYVE